MNASFHTSVRITTTSATTTATVVRLSDGRVVTLKPGEEWKLKTPIARVEWVEGLDGCQYAVAHIVSWWSMRVGGPEFR